MKSGFRLTLCLFLMVTASGCVAARNGQPTLTPLQAQARYKEAEAAYQVGNYQLSHDAFLAAEAAGHQPGPSLVNAGASLLAMRQSSQAVLLLDRATREHPSSAAAWYNYGLALYGTGSFDEANRALRRSIELDSTNADVWAALGATFVSKRQPGVAVEQFNRALDLSPNNSTILTSRAGAHLDAALYEEAERDFQDVLAIGEEPAIAHIGLGEVYLAQKKCRQAIGEFTKAITISPGNSLAHYNRGLSQRICGDSSKAVDDFNRALAYDPEWSEALVMRGDTRLMRRERDLGCKDLVAACEMGNCARLEVVRGIGLCPN